MTGTLFAQRKSTLKLISESYSSHVILKLHEFNPTDGQILNESYLRFHAKPLHNHWVFFLHVCIVSLFLLIQLWLEGSLAAATGWCCWRSESGRIWKESRANCQSFCDLHLVFIAACVYLEANVNNQVYVAFNLLTETILVKTIS